MKCRRAEHGQSVLQKTVRNLFTKDNPRMLPVNLYQRKTIALKPIDLDSFHQATERHRKENQANVQLSALYEAQNVVCMKAERLNICRLLEGIMLRECGMRSPKKVKAINLKRDPFNSNTFYKLGGATSDTGDVICLVENVTYSRDESSLTSSVQFSSVHFILKFHYIQKAIIESFHVKWDQKKPILDVKVINFFQNLHNASTLGAVHRRTNIILKSLVICYLDPIKVLAFAATHSVPIPANSGCTCPIIMKFVSFESSFCGDSISGIKRCKIIKLEC